MFIFLIVENSEPKEYLEKICKERNDCDDEDGGDSFIKSLICKFKQQQAEKEKQRVEQEEAERRQREEEAERERTNSERMDESIDQVNREEKVFHANENKIGKMKSVDNNNYTYNHHLTSSGGGGGGVNTISKLIKMQPTQIIRLASQSSPSSTIVKLANPSSHSFSNANSVGSIGNHGNTTAYSRPPSTTTATASVGSAPQNPIKQILIPKPSTQKLIILPNNVGSSNAMAATTNGLNKSPSSSINSTTSTSTGTTTSTSKLIVYKTAQQQSTTNPTIHNNILTTANGLTSTPPAILSLSSNHNPMRNKQIIYNLTVPNTNNNNNLTAAANSSTATLTSKQQVHVKAPISLVQTTTTTPATAPNTTTNYQLMQLGSINDTRP